MHKITKFETYKCTLHEKTNVRVCRPFLAIATFNIRAARRSNKDPILNSLADTMRRTGVTLLGLTEVGRLADSQIARFEQNNPYYKILASCPNNKKHKTNEKSKKKTRNNSFVTATII